MISSITMHLISAHPLWLRMLERIILELPLGIEFLPVTIEADDSLARKVRTAVANGDVPDLALISIDNSLGGIDLIRTLRTAGYSGPTLVISSHYHPPALEELMSLDVQSIVSSFADLTDLASEISALIYQTNDPLPQTYLRAFGTYNVITSIRGLNPREREILQLVAQDLTDNQIGNYLSISVRTVNNHLRQIYAKLGARTRLGAVVIGISEGIISPIMRLRLK